MTPAPPTALLEGQRLQRRRSRQAERRRSLAVLAAVVVLVSLLAGLLAYGWSNARRITDGGASAAVVVASDIPVAGGA